MLQKYELSDKMIRLVGDNYSNLQATIRLGLPLGVGDKSVKEVCGINDVDAKTFLTVIKFIADGFTQMKDVNNEISVASLLHYLRQSHIYFLEFCLLDIRRKLLDIIHLYNKDISFLMLRLFDEYAKDVHQHMQYEENTVFKYVNGLIDENAPTDYKISTFSKHHDAVGEKMTEFKNILIKYCPETTPILRGGLALVLKNLPNLRIQPIEILSTGSLNDCMQTKAPEILIINPFFDETFDVQKFREEHNNKHIRIIALTHSFINETVLNKYDDTISVFHDTQTLNEKIVRLLHSDNEEEGQESLSTREKEIVVCVVKGMTNKETADSLFLSIHTVITHRRNISRKLQIHSPSGLTIYAIMNKLVNLDEIKLE